MYGLVNGQIQELEDGQYDIELPDPDAFFDLNINMIPLQSAVQGPRLFYGARFTSQTQPLKNPEAPLVRNADSSGVSYDEIAGRQMGALYADTEATVKQVTPDFIELETADGQKVQKSIYNNFPFNRKSGIHSRPLVNPGDKVSAGQLLAASNFTDDEGASAIGVNAVTALVPFEGYSMDDAIVISDSMADKLTSEQIYTHVKEYDESIKGGRDHFASLFPGEFTREQLETMDEHGVVKPGTILKNGDPMILASSPRVFSSSSQALGRLSRAVRQTRAPAAEVWEGEEDAEVVDVVWSPKGAKVVTRSYKRAMPADKIVFRSGQKSIISKILPDDQMPTRPDGTKIEVLLNSLSLPSRVNAATPYELLLGKVARAQGKALKLRGFNAPGESWADQVTKALEDAGLEASETLIDARTNQPLENPVTVGVGYVQKLHHLGDTKISARGQAGYSADQQPLKGGTAGGKAKRLSGLEVHSMLSSGAYANLMEGSTLRGQANDEYWRALRSGMTPKKPGAPFVWDKFKALLTGSGIRPEDRGRGVTRLVPLTDRFLDSQSAAEIENGELVDPITLSPSPGGLFDEGLVGTGRWGRISTPEKFINPLYRKAVASLLGVTQTELDNILDKKEAAPEAWIKRIKDLKKEL